MSPLAILAVVSALVAAASAHVKVFNFERDTSVAAAPSAFAWAPLGVEKTFVTTNDDGNTAGYHEFPHHASMQVSIPGNPSPQHICSGALIADTWVLTAAHCVYGVPPEAENVSVVLGINSLSKDKGQRLNVLQGLVHPQYDDSPSVGPNDIALLKLDGKAKLSWDVKLASLPSNNVLAKGRATLSSWGIISQDGQKYPDKLQTTYFPIVDYQTCSHYISNNIPNEDNPITDTNICVGDLTRTVPSSCTGDSGSPLVQKSGFFIQTTTVIGIASWGLKDCGTVPFPPIFTRVSAYTKWIADVQKSFQ